MPYQHSPVVPNPQPPCPLLAHKTIASHAGVFRGTRISSLLTNACSTENNIPFSLFYLRGK